VISAFPEKPYTINSVNMKYNRFEITVAVQVILIALTGFAGVYAIINSYLHITVSSLALVWILQVVLLVRYVNKTSRDLAYFLQSLKYLDSVNTDESNRSFRRLNITYNEIIDTIRHARIEKEAEHHYFRNTVDHVPTGLISFNEKGETGLINRAALDLLGLTKLAHIDALDEVTKGLNTVIRQLKPGGQTLFSFYRGNELLKLSIRATGFVIREERIKLVSLQDIRAELEEGELDAWQKLIRVLTHEIMNSVSPVKTLSASIIRILGKYRNASGGNPDPVDIENALSGLHAIEKRSNGLIGFVEDYKRLNKIPGPEFSLVRISSLIGNILVLMNTELNEKNITANTVINNEELEFRMDEKLITQVLLNLVGNAVQSAPERGGRIILRAFKPNDSNLWIQVIDNGHGISKDVIDRIFVPFFTTRESGSGIGLSLSRQIMRLHRGSISVVSDPGKETVFTLKF
jgi:two-component system nitrogen regulation sensor histidine kinase NtrY